MSYLEGRDSSPFTMKRRKVDTCFSKGYALNRRGWEKSNQNEVEVSFEGLELFSLEENVCMRCMSSISIIICLVLFFWEKAQVRGRLRGRVEGESEREP